MLFQGIFTLLLFLGALYAVWKFIILPRIPDEPKEEEHERILREKLEKLEKLRSEAKSVRKEKDVTAEIKNLDEQIDETIRQIKEAEK